MADDTKNYEQDYSEHAFWGKIKSSAIEAGKEVTEKALLLYYAACDPRTPACAKTTCYGALGYFISPLDAIPDMTPIVGFVDDLGVLTFAVATVAAYIDQGLRDETREKMKDWFS